MLDANAVAQTAAPNSIMNTRVVLTVIWLFLTLFLGLIQVPMGTVAHHQTARRLDPNARWRESLKHSLADLHLFVFSIATCGGIIITIFGTMINQSASGANHGPWNMLNLLLIIIACILITFFSGICWATNRAASGVQQLGATTGSIVGDERMIFPSILFAGAAISAGVITELVK